MEGKRRHHGSNVNERTPAKKPKLQSREPSFNSVSSSDPPNHLSDPPQQSNHSDYPPPLPPILDETLASQVFTHTSVLSGDQTDYNDSYERLEWIGDAQLQKISSDVIYPRFPNMTAGQLSSTRELLVRNSTLSAYARLYGLDKRIRATPVERGSRVWPKIEGDVFEAYVGAVILSAPAGGYEIAVAWLRKLWEPKLQEVTSDKPTTSDVKMELGKLLTSKGIKLDYRNERPMQMDKNTGKQKFFIGVYLTGWGYDNKWLGSGSGQNKVDARTAAAANAMSRSWDIIQHAHQQKIAFDQKKREETEAEKERQANGQNASTLSKLSTREFQDLLNSKKNV